MAGYVSFHSVCGKIRLIFLGFHHRASMNLKTVFMLRSAYEADLTERIRNNY